MGRSKRGLIDPGLPNVTEYDDSYDKASIGEVQAAAQKGSAVALYELASRFRLGVDGADMNPAKAVKFYKEVLKYQNNREAFYHIGYLLCDGALGDKHASECVEYFLAACDMGSSRAAAQLAILYEYGEFVEQDFDRAIEYYDKAIELGNGNGSERINKARLFEKLGKLDLARQCYMETLAFFDKEIEKADPAELSWLWGQKGNIYNSLGDYLSAKSCYEKALSYGENAEAATFLGTIYEDGIPGVLESDNAKAYYYYVKGYEAKEHRYAELNIKMLAIFLFNEKAGKGNDYKAFKLFNELRELGVKAANIYLGYYYGTGIQGSVDVNVDLAFQLLDDVPDYDEAAALYYKGFIYLTTLNNEEAAKKYLAEAAAKGEEQAAVLLEQLSKRQNPLAVHFNKAAEMLGDHALAAELKKAANLGPDPHTVVQYTQKIIKANRLDAAVALISGGYRVFPDNPEVIDTFIWIYDILLYGKYVTGNFKEGDENLCYMVLDLIKKLRSISYSDARLDAIESDMYFNLGSFYQDKDDDKALSMYAKANIDYTPRTAVEVFGIHTQHLDRYINDLYIDLDNLLRSLKSDRWHEERFKALAYFAISEIYRNGAPRVKPNLETALKYLELACKADPKNKVYADIRKKYKRNVFGKLSYKD